MMIVSFTSQYRFLATATVLLLVVVTRIQGFATTPTTARNRQSRTPTARKAFAMDASSAVESFFQTQPYVSAFLTCSFKASAADFMVQTKASTTSGTTATTTTTSSGTTTTTTTRTAPEAQVAALPVVHKEDSNNDDDDDDKSLDMSRNLAFLLYGGVYQGLAQQFMYSNLFPDLFGDSSTWQSVAMQVGFDMLIIGPFLCLPVAYAVKSIFQSSSDKEVEEEEDAPNMKDRVLSGLDKYVEDVMERGLLLKYWALWIPVQTLTFGVIPHHFRVAFVAAVSFFWVTILSSISAATTAQEDSNDNNLATTTTTRTRTASPVSVN